MIEVLHGRDGSSGRGAPSSSIFETSEVWGDVCDVLFARVGVMVVGLYAHNVIYVVSCSYYVSLR